MKSFVIDRNADLSAPLGEPMRNKLAIIAKSVPLGTFDVEELALACKVDATYFYSKILPEALSYLATKGLHKESLTNEQINSWEVIAPATVSRKIAADDFLDGLI